VTVLVLRRTGTGTATMPNWYWSGGLPHSAVPVPVLVLLSALAALFCSCCTGIEHLMLVDKRRPFGRFDGFGLLGSTLFHSSRGRTLVWFSSNMLHPVSITGSKYVRQGTHMWSDCCFRRVDSLWTLWSEGPSGLHQE